MSAGVLLKNVVLALLLANLLLLAWQRWILPPDAGLPGRADFAAGQQLVLLGAPDTQSVDAPPSGPGCTRIGPFADVDMADSVGAQLESDRFGVRRTSQAGKVWVGYWVQVPDLKTRENAARVVEQLNEAGLRDAYIFQTEPVINVSLGVFRSRAGAERVAGLARDLGLAPQMTDRFQPGVEHWLTVESRSDRLLSLGNVKLGATQILRTEAVPCEGDSAVNARIQP